MFAKQATEIANFLAQKNLAKPLIILALSGGPDSVFLFHVLLLLQKLGVATFIALHVNHEWRNADAAEEDFCRKLASAHNRPLIVRYAHQTKLKNAGSLEEYGRRLRLFFLQQAMRQKNAQLICTAHQQDDLLETFFIRLIRGSSLVGLGSILPFNPPFYRPLLAVRKSEIIAHLQKQAIPFCLDETNATDAHLRNRIRNHLLLELTNIDPRAESKFCSTINFLQEEAALLDALVLEKFTSLAVQDEAKYFLDLKQFLQQPPLLQKKLLQQLLRKNNCKIIESQAVFTEMLRFVNNNKSSTHQIANFIVSKKKGRIGIAVV